MLANMAQIYISTIQQTLCLWLYIHLVAPDNISSILLYYVLNQFWFSIQSELYYEDELLVYCFIIAISAAIITP